MLLLFAAVAKAQVLSASPPSSISWSQFFLVQAELLLGLWFLFGGYGRVVRGVAIALFTAFALYNAYLVFLRAPSCGCFGRVEVRPWVTLLLDSAIVFGLLGWPPAAGSKTVSARATLAATVVFWAVANGLLLLRFSW